ncbi:MULTISPECIES: RagB/SusD family nutrient uptake outer membrane protein [Sphingobacterium]|uniref:RagB/SusD family nutrient uptake outer membrane protein n=1 Tax=Sphingobacterium TaxID=28453 RepID=UPI00257BDF41|nr:MULTISPECIES: RagB/SusD family nutrient uptake outer membrane protein [Sphingobacterium]
MKKIFRILILSMSLAIITGCEGYLDKEPLSEIPESEYFRNAQDLEFFTNPLYNMLNMNDRLQSDHLVQMTLSDMIIGGDRRTVPNSGGGWEWADLRRINTLLARVNQCNDQAAVLKYSAVARFFRAMFYFNMIKQFGDVPWYDTELGPSDISLYKKRDPRELIMSKIVEDIDYAIANLPVDVSTFRVNKWAALALKARFCLYEGTYLKYRGSNEGNKYLELSAAASRTLIDGNRYKLYTNGGKDRAYFSLFSQDNADQGEFILAIDYSSSPRVNHNASSFTMSAAQGRPSYTKKLVNTYLMTDGTRFTDLPGWQTMTFIDEVKNRDPRLSQSIRNPEFTLSDNKPFPNKFAISVDGYHPIKFLQDQTKGYDVRVGYSSNDLPVFRYAEVLLNYAEAKAELGILTQEDINISIKLLRDRVGMPNLNMVAANTNPDPYLLSPQTGYTNLTSVNRGVILEIRRERAIELVEEGFRVDDLMRWKSGYCLDQPLVGIYFPGAGEYDLSGDGKADLILYNKGNKPPSQVGVEMYEIGTPVNSGGIILTEGNKGNVFFHSNIKLAGFNEQRDYLYPIPINERSLNHNLSQNPGWNDGLSF